MQPRPTRQLTLVKSSDIVWAVCDIKEWAIQNGGVGGVVREGFQQFAFEVGGLENVPGAVFDFVLVEQEPWTIGALALRPTGNHQGSRYFMSLESVWIITRKNHATRLPMPNQVIQQVTHLAGEPNGQ